MKLSRTEDTRFQLDKVRLPLVALIDVVLFLLMYFVIAGTLAAEESQLAASLKTDRKGGRQGSDLQPLVLNVEPAGGSGAYRFRLGERVVPDQTSLAALLKQLPKEDGIVVRISDAVTVDAAGAALQAVDDAGFAKVSYVPGK
jgi:biopolymer transport protein ExbD